jgi:hypothetical protein
MLYEMRRAHPMADRIGEFDRVGASQPVVDR